MNPCKREGCRNFARRDYCSNTCRKAAWLERHILRCPHCHQALPAEFKLAGQSLATEPRSARSERQPQEEPSE